MSKIPEDLKYTKTHEWVKLTGNIAEIGITDYADSPLSVIKNQAYTPCYYCDI